jgi:phospholipase D1/2
MGKLLPERVRKSANFKLILFAVLLVVVCTVAAIWRFIPLADYLESDKLLALKLQLRSSPLGPFIAIALYVIGGLIVFPVFILIPATTLVFGPILGALYSLLGILANASVLYIIGFVLGHETVNRLTGSRVNQVSQLLAHRSFLTSVTLRFLPIAPFTVINLISGASHIRFREYFFGTLIGISPAIIIMTLLENQLERTVRNPDLENLLIILVLSMVVLLAVLWSKKRFDNTRK